MKKLQICSVLAMGFGILCPSSSVLAGGRHLRIDKADADIDHLDASLRPSDGGWSLAVRFDVELEDARLGDRFDLVLTLSDGSRGFRDAGCRPFEITVPLQNPVRIRDHGREFRFRDEIVAQIPGRILARPDKLKIHARVVSVRSRCVLDEDSTSVRFDRSPRLPRDMNRRHPNWK